MTDGPFRDDKEAAIARAEALEAELAHEKAENARLRAELAGDPPAAPAEPPPTPPSLVVERGPIAAVARWCFRRAWIVVVVVFVGIKPLVDCRRTGAWIDERVELTYRTLRWRAMTAIAACVRVTEVRAMTIAGLDAETADPRKPESRAAEVASVHLHGYRSRRTSDRSGVHTIAFDCLERLTISGYWDEFRDHSAAHDHDSTLSRFPEPAQRLLADWLAKNAALDTASTQLADYYAKRDYLDDDFRAGPRLWTALRAALAERDAAVARVRAEALPAIRDLMRAEQADYERQFGRDATWWRVELGFFLDDVIDAAFRAHLAGRGDAEIADLVREPTRRLLETAKQAPLDVRREVRTIAELDRMAASDGVTWATIEELAAWPTRSIWDDDGNYHDRSMAPVPPDPPKPDGLGGCYSCAR